MELPGNEIQSVLNGVGLVPVRTPTLPPATHTNVWILGEHHVTVVDPASPYPDEQHRLDEILEAVLVERIVLTHHHKDHIGGALALQKTTGAKIAAHPATRELLEFEVDESLEHDDVIATDAGYWKIVHTPGHAPGHICLRNGGLGAVVAGDMVAGVGTILIDPADGNLEQYLHSLHMLRDTRPKFLLPAHGPVIENGDAYLGEYIDHRNARTEQIVSHLVKKPGLTAEKIAQLIYESQVPLELMPIATRQVEAHLIWLQEKNRVSCHENGFYIQ